MKLILAILVVWLVVAVLPMLGLHWFFFLLLVGAIVLAFFKAFFDAPAPAESPSRTREESAEEQWEREIKEAEQEGWDNFIARKACERKKAEEDAYGELTESDEAREVREAREMREAEERFAKRYPALYKRAMEQRKQTRAGGTGES